MVWLKQAITCAFSNKRVTACWLLLMALVSTRSVVNAAETDQFTLPAENNFADLGPEITSWYFEVLQSGVAHANAEIQGAIDRQAPANELAFFQSDESVVKAVDGVCLRGNDIVENVEHELKSAPMRLGHPGQRTYFREVFHDIYYQAFFILDPKILSRFYIGSTVKAFGTYFGTDKFGHFTAIGISYYWSYREAIKAGATENEALHQAVENGTTGSQSEAGIMGLATTGDYSNADLAANYSGFLFFRNLTTAVSIHGQVHPPLLVRNGAFWRLAPQVTPRSQFFAPFISDHWNEALNPGWFVESMRPTLRHAIHDRREIVLRYYADPHITPTPQYFRALRYSLQSYWSQDYGHRGDDHSLVDIADNCFR